MEDILLGLRKMETAVPCGLGISNKDRNVRSGDSILINPGCCYIWNETTEFDEWFPSKKNTDFIITDL